MIGAIAGSAIPLGRELPTSGNSASSAWRPSGFSDCAEVSSRPFSPPGCSESWPCSPVRLPDARQRRAVAETSSGMWWPLPFEGYDGSATLSAAREAAPGDVYFVAWAHRVPRGGGHRGLHPAREGVCVLEPPARCRRCERSAFQDGSESDPRLRVVRDRDFSRFPRQRSANRASTSTCGSMTWRPRLLWSESSAGVSPTRSIPTTKAPCT